MRKIKLFLASSAELDSDKEQLEIFVSRKNKDWHNKRLFIELTTWRDFISSMVKGRTQEEYNTYIRNSDIVVFLFHTKLGRYTKEEFAQAHEAFMRCTDKVKKPRIYTYFKTCECELNEITDFRRYIDSLDHFYDTYSSMEDLFVKFNRQLDKLENEGLIIKPEVIDVPKVIKYTANFFLIPLLVLLGAFFALYYFQPVDITVRLTEKNAIATLPFKNGCVSLVYGDKTEEQTITNETVFKQIPSKYKRNSLHLQFNANGYCKVDTMVRAKKTY